MKKTLITLSILVAGLTGSAQQALAQDKPLPTYEQYVKKNVPSKGAIEIYLKSELTWSKFNPVVGYTLGNFLPRDGMDGSLTISTSKPNGARTASLYVGKPCRINTYGDSFTQCHQVSDGETWEEYLAAHLGEPIRNFGMGGFGVYQAYRRMLLEEATKDSAKYTIFYVWGDDHTRSLLRCRYFVFAEGFNELSDKDLGENFHNNTWSNLEMDLNTGKFVENKSFIDRREDLVKMADADWMYGHLKTDLALQMYLYKDYKTSEIDIASLKKLSRILDFPIDLDTPATLRENVGKLLDKYGFAATRYTLDKTKEYAENNGKKLLVVIFDPYRVTYPILDGATTLEARYDKEIVDYLQNNGFNYFDMNLVQMEDFKAFKLSLKDYWKRYFIGHYNPAGNHFFAYSIAPKIIDWLDPKPITYRKTDQELIDFKGYLDMKSMDKK